MSLIRGSVTILPFDSNETLTKIEVSSRHWGNSVMDLIMFLFEKMWILKLWIWKVVKGLK